MKKLLPLFTCTLLLFSCTFEKGEIVLPVQDCVQDTTVDVVPVSIIDFGYTPTAVEVIAGDTIDWKNTSTSPHTVTCDGSAGTSRPSGASAFDSGVTTPINPGEHYKVVLSVPGNYTYLCVYHTGMTGTIVVKPRCQ